ncbi:MAG: DUF5686 and carboxypeptidase regulatory-like domain-containing protein [Bacteroidota bacterium]|nr:DUF5686 and carboxypeptidase regulatory-like domain-containing protein [Bacteroidota bacterium]
MLRSLLCLSLFLFNTGAFAGKISGIVTDDKGTPLPYASISIKGTTKGTNANSSGHYSITLSPGQYTLIGQYVGYKKEEKTIIVTEDDQVINFVLSIQQLTLQEVIVKKGEDPAYEIIRQAIKKRSFYNNQVDSFAVDVYIKGLLRSKGLPVKVFGKKVEREKNDGLDSMGKGILFLSESVTKVFFQKPDKIKYQVISSRQSGGGYGLSFPFFINFYQNNVSVFDNNLNPRGFISPIADGALNYYKYHYEGSFIEDNKMVNTIKVTPRRKNEPLFSGTIQITEDDWRIYSLDLLTTSDYSLELIDTLRISQIHSAIAPGTWKTKNQVMYVSVKKLGFDFAGNFVNVYSDYDLNPGFTKKTFDRVIMKYDSAFNRKDTSYWNKVRPVALEQDEKRDFVFKDSIAKVTRDSFLTRRNLDSLRKNQKPVTFKNILWSGASHNFYNKKTTIGYHLKPLLPQLEYNTVEGVSVNAEQTFSLSQRKGKYNYILDWNARYGFSNSHFNSYGSFLIKPRRENYRNRYLKLSGGKRISQFNQDNPINPLTNEVYTLLARKNYMKLYENWFGGIEYNNRFENGLRLNLHAVYEDRIPVENSTDFSFFKKDSSRVFSPNHPYELSNIPFNRHQALVAGFALTWQPGQHYIQFPWGKIPVGSKAPTFELEYNKGIQKILGSDVDFDKWKLSLFDNMNFRIGGEFRYRISIGGFLNNKDVEIPDLQHFNGNQTFYNIKYLNSFQLAPYYRYSNDERFYVLAHAEHHFNGLLTNKIPLLNKLKWNLVVGSNTFYINGNNYYAEVFAGIENIFKLFRVDFVNAYQPGTGNQFGVRVGFGGLLGGKMSFTAD